MLQMIKRLRNRLLVLPAVLLLLASCGEKKHADVLPPEKLEDILYDYHLAQVMISDLPSSERYKKDLYFDYVYNKHNVTKAQIDSSLVYYARYPKALSVVYTNLSQRIEHNLQQIENEALQADGRTAKAITGDSVDLWYDSRLKLLNTSPLTNHFSFVIPNDTNFKDNDRFEWSGEVLFLNDGKDSQNQYLQLAFTAKFANDSLLSVDTLLFDSGPFMLQLLDTAKVQLSKLYGNVFYKNNESASGILLYQMQLMRYHHMSPKAILHPDSGHIAIEKGLSH